MAPCSSAYSSGHRDTVQKKSNNRLRKPAVEKRRRDRINSSIEQLKVILEKDFHRRNLSSKLEKADILEMTVSLLRQQLEDGAHPRRESDLFLSAPSRSEPSITPPPDLQHQHHRGSAHPPKTPQNGSRVWRPW